MAPESFSPFPYALNSWVTVPLSSVMSVLILGDFETHVGRVPQTWPHSDVSAFSVIFVLVCVRRALPWSHITDLVLTGVPTAQALSILSTPPPPKLLRSNLRSYSDTDDPVTLSPRIR